MATKKTTAKKTPATTPAKKVTPVADKPRTLAPHELMLMPTAQNASAMEKFSCYGEADVVGLIKSLGEKVEKIQDGNMKPVDAMLYGQAQALQAIFTNMARRSALNAGEYINASETYMKLALKAQSQCRATLETLAIVKNPQPYIRQANMTTGPQQVNNAYAGTPSHSGIQSRTGNIQSEQNKLLEADHGNYLDTRAQSTAGRVNQTVDAVG